MSNVARLSYVCVIAPVDNGRPHGPSNVGIAVNPATRLAALQLGNPLQLSVIRAFPFSGRDKALEAEEIAHLGYSDKRMIGEWFDADPADLIGTIEDIVRSGDVE